MKRFVSILLSIVLSISMCSGVVYSSSSEDIEYSKEIETTVYWMKNEQSFEKLFNVMLRNSDDISLVHKITIHDIKESDDLDKRIVEYEISIFDQLFNLQGIVTEQKYENQLLYIGKVSSSVLINNVKCDIYGSIHCNPLTGDINAGITISPEYAESLDDFVFMGIGDVIFHADFLNRTSSNSGNDYDSVHVSDVGQLRDDDENDGYDYKNGKNVSFVSGSGVSGTNALTLHTYYNMDYNRICISAKSYVSNINNYFTSGNNSAISYVDTLSLSLNTTNTDSYYSIVNFQNYYSGMHYLGSFINNTFINNIIDIIQSFINTGFWNAAVTVFRAGLNALIGDSSAKYTASLSGQSVVIDFDYAQGGLSLKPITYDEGEYPVKVNVKTTKTGNYGFYTSGSIGYYVIVADMVTNESTVLFLDSQTGNSNTYYCYIFK